MTLNGEEEKEKVKQILTFEKSQINRKASTKIAKIPENYVIVDFRSLGQKPISGEST